MNFLENQLAIDNMQLARRSDRSERLAFLPIANCPLPIDFFNRLNFIVNSTFMPGKAGN